GRGNELFDPRAESARIATLDVDQAGTAEATDQSLTRGEAGNPTGCGLFDAVGCRPCPRHEVAVIHDVLLVRFELDFVNRAETVEDQRAEAPDLQKEEPFSAEQAAAETL